MNKLVKNKDKLYQCPECGHIISAEQYKQYWFRCPSCYGARIESFNEYTEPDS